MRLLRWIGRNGALLLTAVWFVVLLASITAPILAETCPLGSAGCYLGLAPLCHQSAERSFAIMGHKLGLCARCTGIFAGLFVFGVFSMMLKRRFALPLLGLLAFVAPLAIDGLAQTFGLWNTGNIPRFIVGAVSAFGIVFWIYPIIFEMNSDMENSAR